MKVTIETHPSLEGETWNLPTYEIESVQELFEASAYLLAIVASEAGVNATDLTEPFLGRVMTFLDAQAKPTLRLMH